MTLPLKSRTVYSLLAGGAVLACALATGVGYAGGQPDISSNSVCELLAEKHGTSISLQAVLYPGLAGQGEYRLSVETAGNGGRSVINQGGPFATDGGKELTLGSVHVPASSTYKASFEVVLGGHTYTCPEASDRIV